MKPTRSATIVALALTLMAVRSFRNSRSGRVLIATRDNPRAAQAFGSSAAQAQTMTYDPVGNVTSVAEGGATTTLYQYDPLNRALYLWFDGDGMMNFFRFGKDGVDFRNRYVHTPKWTTAE